MRSLVSVCQHVWILPVEMCSIHWWLQKKLKWICRAGFHTSLFHSCHAGGGWSHIFLLLNSYLWSYVWPPNLPLLLSSLAPPPFHPPHPPIPLGAEVIQKECRALVQQMIEGEKETEERKESNTKIKDWFFFVVVLSRTFCFAFPWELWSTSENRVCVVWAFFWRTSEKHEKHLWLYVFKTIWVCLLLSSKRQSKEILENKERILVISIHCKSKSYSLIYAYDFTAQMPINVQSSHIWINPVMTELTFSSPNTDTFQY